MGFLSTLTGSDGAKSARDAAVVQIDAGQKAIGHQTEMLGQARGDLTPFAQAGTDALSQLQGLLTGQGQADFLNDSPLFQNVMQNVNRSTNAMQAARGQSLSGNTLNALQSNYLQQALPFLQNQQGMLGNLTGMGANAAGQQANLSFNTGQSIGDLYTQIGNASAGGIMGASNARSAGMGNMLGLGAMAFGGMGGMGGLGSMMGGGAGAGLGGTVNLGAFGAQPSPMFNPQFQPTFSPLG